MRKDVGAAGAGSEVTGTVDPPAAGAAVDAGPGDGVVTEVVTEVVTGALGPAAEAGSPPPTGSAVVSTRRAAPTATASAIWVRAGRCSRRSRIGRSTNTYETTAIAAVAAHRRTKRLS